MLEILFFLLVSFSAHAEITELAPGLTVDTSISTQKLASCGTDVPGDVCLLQCYDVVNATTDNYYTCNLQATGNFNEKISATNGSILYTGNTLSATDYRSVVIYPYQNVSVCFNYGKEVVSSPSQPNSMWVYASSTITASSDANPQSCIGGTVGPAPTSPEEGSTPTI